MQIRPATDDDFPGIWHIFRHVAAAGDSFPHAVDVSRDEAFHYWMRPPRVAYVAITTEGEVAGMYYLRPNQEALGGTSPTPATAWGWSIGVADWDVPCASTRWGRRGD